MKNIHAFPIEWHDLRRVAGSLKDCKRFKGTANDNFEASLLISDASLEIAIVYSTVPKEPEYNISKWITL